MASTFVTAPRAFVALLMIAVIAAPASAQFERADACSPFWVPDFGLPGATATVRACTIFDDGSGDGPCLFVGGLFNAIGGVSANHVAKWNGRVWSALGTGTNGVVRSFASFDEGGGAGPVLFVGGNFTSAGGLSANGIARWDGNAWSPVSGASNAADNGVNGWVGAMTVFDDHTGAGSALMVGGFFSAAEGIPASCIARWSGTQWSAVGEGLNGTVFTLATFGHDGSKAPELYAGGWFTLSGSAEMNHIARWNGASWLEVQGGVDSGVHALTVWHDGLGGGPALYVGGFFSTAGRIFARNIARWSGTEWSPLSSEVLGPVQSLTVHNDGTGGGPALYAGGNMLIPSGESFIFAGASRWDGETWTLLGGATNDEVYCVLGAEGASVVGNALYIGGAFQMVGGVASHYLARWQGCLSPTRCVTEDFNCDGAVDGDDLGMLLGSWGPCRGCAADLNGDGFVGGDDLGTLLGAWGP